MRENGFDKRLHMLFNLDMLVVDVLICNFWTSEEESFVSGNCMIAFHLVYHFCHGLTTSLLSSILPPYDVHALVRSPFVRVHHQNIEDPG